MNDFERRFQHIEIVENEISDRLRLDLVERLGDVRKAKIKNNFIGLLEPANSELLATMSLRLAAKLELPADATIVGMHKSGIVVAVTLAQALAVNFSWTTPDKLGEDFILYEEDHRPDKAHYLYGIKPGDSVVLVEDEITSGKGIAGFANVLTKNAINVVGIASYLETINFAGRELIAQETGIELVSLVKVKLS